MTDKTTLTRRQLLKGTLYTGAALTFGCSIPGLMGESAHAGDQSGTEYDFVPNVWIRIDRDDTVTIMVNHSEMGQGVLTSLPMIAAEEMDADWSKVKGEHAPAHEAYKNPSMRMQATGGSTSVTTTWNALRQAGANVRQLFINAAAQKWQVNSKECDTENSKVIHKPSGKTLRYGELINLASKLDIPENASMKKKNDFRLIGNSLPRLDTPPKLDGSAVFGMDVKLPGLLVATVVHPPVFGTKAKSVNIDDALKMPGVKHVFQISAGVAVVGDTFWQVLKASEAIEIEWTKPEKKHVNTADLESRWEKLADEEGDITFEQGDPDALASEKGKLVEADYQLPFQAHATQEPMNCTADVREDGCDIWVPTQNQGGTQGVAANLTGLDRDQVKVHTTFLGGGFGRRAELDFVVEAVEISMKLKKPVKLIWSREADMKNDVYRPASYNRMKAIIDENGIPIAWVHRMVGMDHFVQVIPKFIPAMVPEWFPNFMKRASASIGGSLMSTFGAGKGLLGGAGPIPYDIKNVKVEFVEDDIGVPVGFWRSVANSSNGFVVESFIDELAYAANKDPYEYRFILLQSNPRLQKTLKIAAEKSAWGTPTPKGVGRGITSHIFHDTLISMVAEVQVDDEGNVKANKFVCAVDCGVVVNPKIIKAQMESAIVYGLTATLKSAITVTNGTVDQSNFDSFPILTFAEMPTIETHIVESNEKPTGIGEVGTPTTAPAIANAIYAATGKRIRKLPVIPDDLTS